MLPPPLQPGGPPLWGGGRSPAALARLGRLADGWISYVVTPERYAAGLVQIERAAEQAGRRLDAFGTGHLLFVAIDDSYEKAWDAASEHLSRRYASDFRAAAKKYDPDAIWAQSARVEDASGLAGFDASEASNLVLIGDGRSTLTDRVVGLGVIEIRSDDTGVSATVAPIHGKGARFDDGQERSLVPVSKAGDK